MEDYLLTNACRTTGRDQFRGMLERAGLPAAQAQQVTEIATGFYNERQRVEIDLVKSLETDEAYGVGMNGEIYDVTFGLYAAEEIKAADGTAIPADGLIEVIFLDGDGHGTAISDLPIGSYYMKETKAPDNYRLSPVVYQIEVIKEDVSVLTKINGSKNTLTLVNTQEGTSGDLKIRKELKGNDTDSDMEFKFRIQAYSQQGKGILCGRQLVLAGDSDI